MNTAAQQTAIKSSPNLINFSQLERLKEASEKYHYCDEKQLVNDLLNQVSQTIDWDKVQKRAIRLVKNARKDKKNQTMMDDLLGEYSLSNKEGVLLMCLAEALIRIPDEKTAEKFIQSILSAGNWKTHLQKQQSLLINASTWGLMFGEKMIAHFIQPEKMITSLVSRLGLKTMRVMIAKSITIIAKQFVLSPNIEKALSHAKNELKEGYLYTFDMLGEAALTLDDAEVFFQKYTHAIKHIGSIKGNEHTISIKLSALYPRYEYRQREDVLEHLGQKVEELVLLAIDNNLAVSIDAEESERLLISLEVIENLFKNPKIAHSEKLGVVIQAYSKRCLAVLEYLNFLAQSYKTNIAIRLVKGAYWDTEIKKAQQLGLDDFPVFTRKENTDLNYLIAAQYLFQPETQKNLTPQFATHNAHTISSILQMAKSIDNPRFEFQKLHGMGQTLYSQILEKGKIDCRVYAPIGEHQYLLPYLVRRLLENGANSSFVNRLIDNQLPAKKLAIHPFDQIQEHQSDQNLAIKKPIDIFKPRKNSTGINIQDPEAKEKFDAIVQQYCNHSWQAKSILAIESKNSASEVKSETIPYFSPNDLSHQIAEVELLEKDHSLVDAIYQSAHQAFINQNNALDKRALVLLKLADLLELNRDELVALCLYETGKVYQDAIDEIREAVDFCRYYAEMGQKELISQHLPGPSGEQNIFTYTGKGVFLCISPWNFPLAIFIGQIAASYMAGNAVIAKPSPLSPVIAKKAIDLMHQAGASKNLVQLILCKDEINPLLTSHPKLDGVMFTGSTQTAQKIQHSLVSRENSAIATLVAETGGLNAMIVDSSALAEQVVIDILASSFQSAGQRCSALRIALIQEEVYDQIFELLKGGVELLKVNHPKEMTTDIGPVIDSKAEQKINHYIQTMSKKFNCLSAKIKPETKGFYVAPTLIEINQFEDVTEEIFGPVLHLLKFKNNQLIEMIEKINSSGFGLTLGIHSRNQQTQQLIANKARVGNVYINRNQIGAIVGSQPFGGRGFSGTGPKAGGPNYLKRLVDEKTISNNIAAIGGNPDLLSGNNQLA